MNFRWKTNGNDYIDFWLADVCCHFKKKKNVKLTFGSIFSILRRRIGHVTLICFSGEAGEVIQIYNSKVFKK